MGALSLNTRYEYKADDFGTLIAENGAQIVEEENAKHAIQFGMTYSASADYSASAKLLLPVRPRVGIRILRA